MLNLTIDESRSIKKERTIDGYQNMSNKELDDIFSKLPVPLARPKKPFSSKTYTLVKAHKVSTLNI